MEQLELLLALGQQPQDRGLGVGGWQGLDPLLLEGHRERGGERERVRERG